MKLLGLVRSPGGLAWTAAVVLATFQACSSAEPLEDGRFGGGPQRDAGNNGGSSGGSSGTGTSSGDGGSSGGPETLNIIQISSLVYHTCAVWNDGVLKCWGMNAYGALGLGDTVDRGVKPGDMGENLPAIDVGRGRRVKRVATGYFSTCALLDDSTVKCWGDSFESCGDNFDESCGIGYGDRKRRGDQPGEMGDALPALDLGAPAKDISCGTFSCCALLANDAIKCWGENVDGVLGYGDELSRGDQPGEMGNDLPAVDVGVSGVNRLRVGSALLFRHACAALKNGEMKCWGNNSDGQLGVGDTMTRGDDSNEMGTALKRVMVDDFIADVAAGDGASCALTAEGQIRCWGDNSGGQLGLGDTMSRGGVPDQNFPLVQIGGNAVDVGMSQHACAVLDTGAVKCWGPNQFLLADDAGISPSGRLGYGDILTRGSAPGQMGTDLPAIDLGTTAAARQLALGSAHTCVRFIDGKVKCFGENFRGALGLGDDETRGDQRSDMGDDLPFVDLGR